MKLIIDCLNGKFLTSNSYPQLLILFFSFFAQQEREHYEYVVTEGKIIHKLSGQFLDTNKGTQGVKWIFVVSPSHKLYAGEVCIYIPKSLTVGSSLCVYQLLSRDC